MTMVPKFQYDRSIERVLLALVDPPFFNPPQRVAKVDNLVESLTTEGQLELVHLVKFPNGRYQIADGSRRCTALKKLGASHVNAHVYDGGANDATAREILFRLYEELNKPKMTLKNSHMTQAHLRGGPAFDSRVKGPVAKANSLFDNEIPTILKESFNSTLMSTITRTVKYVTPGQPQKGDRHVTLMRKTSLWMVRLHQQQKAIAYMRLGWSAARLLNAIENNLPVPGMDGK